MVTVAGTATKSSNCKPNLNTNLKLRQILTFVFIIFLQYNQFDFAAGLSNGKSLSYLTKDMGLAIGAKVKVFALLAPEANITLIQAQRVRSH